MLEVAVVRFPGSNCDLDAVHAADPDGGGVAEAEGAEGVLHRLALRIQQAGPRHDSNVYPVAHRSSGSCRRSPQAFRRSWVRGGSSGASPSARCSAIGPAGSGRSIRPSTVARAIPKPM